MTRYEELDLEPIAKHVFEQFLVLKPHVPVEGLFRKGHCFFIVAPGIITKGPEIDPVYSWFVGHLRPAAHTIELVATRPEGTVEVPCRTVADLANGHGVVRTWHGLRRDLAVMLPQGFPLLGIRDEDRTAFVLVARPLTPEEENELERTLSRLGASVPHRVEVVSEQVELISPEVPSSKRKAGGSHDLALVPARHLHPTTSSALRELVAKDDDYWRSEGISFFSGQALSADPKPADWNLSRACLVPCTLGPTNIRSYLTLYSTVVLVAPIAESLERTLTGLGVSRSDLRELSHLGHVRWLLPQSVDRYDQGWLSELAEDAPRSLLFSRRLAVLAARDQRERNPLYSLSATSYERRAILRTLHRSAEAANERSRTGVFGRLRGIITPHGDPVALYLETLARALTEHWAASEQFLQQRGAMASISGALARHAIEIGKQLYGRDLFIELGGAAQSIEWAGALGAHVVPEEVDGYSEANASAFLVALCSGGGRQPIATRAPSEVRLAQDLLAFDNDTNVIDFVTDLGTGDLKRIEPIIKGLATGTDADLPEKVRMWNAQVRHYERRPDRLKSFGIAGLVLASGSLLSSSDTIRQVVPLLAPLVPFLTTCLQEELTRESTLVGTLSDWANGALAGAAPDAVLVSRMRKRIKGMKE